MNLPLKFEEISWQDSPQGYLRPIYVHSDKIMESMEIGKRINHLTSLTIQCPKLNTKNITTIAILLHELGHVHYKRYLISKNQINFEELLEEEYKASAYALRGIKEKYHKDVLLAMSKAVINKTKRHLYLGGSIPFPNTEEYHKEQILKYYRKGL